MGEPDGSPGICVERQAGLQRKGHLNTVQNESQQERGEEANPKFAQADEISPWHAVMLPAQIGAMV